MAKTCFVITPIGDEKSETRRQIDGLLKGVLRPVLQKKGYDTITAAHEISELGSINNQVIKRIINDDLVIANLTNNNPNVMYELAIRHATKKPVIHICEHGTALPFDIKGERTLFYINDFQGAVVLGEKLDEVLSQIDTTKGYEDNPIYSAMKLNTIINQTLSEQTDANGKRRYDEYIMEKLDKIDSALYMLTQRDSYPAAGTYFFGNTSGYSPVDTIWKDINENMTLRDHLQSLDSEEAKRILEKCEIADSSAISYKQDGIKKLGK